MQVIHHGAHQGVTGSCHQLIITDSQSLLIDCGLFQGNDELEQAKGAGTLSDTQKVPAPYQDASGLSGLIITHAHIDHVGRLPELLEAGFNAPIYCTDATAALLPMVMEDALSLTRRGSDRANQLLINKMRRLLVPLGYDHWYELKPLALTLRLRQAGHILGSAYAEIENSDGYRVVFSGDIGCKNTPLLPDPTPLERADLLILESTYGDRNHDDRGSRQQRLQAVIERAISDGGSVLIPAFSIGRTQELLYEIEDIIHANPHWRKMTVILDSPLAKRYTAQYRKLKRLWDDEAKQRLDANRQPLNFARLHRVESHQEHQNIVGYLQQHGDPCIVIAASGMCTGGRIVNYLKALLPDPRTDVIFVGYQAAGTPGRAIQQYGPTGGYVTLDHERITIAASIHTIGGYSAHADQRELLEFMQTTEEPVKAVRLVHGELPAKQALAVKIAHQFGLIAGL